MIECDMARIERAPRASKRDGEGPIDRLRSEGGRSMSTGAAPTPMPTDAQRKAFAAKLTQFRGSLDPTEATMLDALVHAARQAHSQGDVQVYWMTGLT